VQEKEVMATARASTFVVAAFVAAACVPGFVLGAATAVSTNIMQVSVSTGGGATATYSAAFPQNNWTGVLNWSLPGKQTLSDGATPLAILNSMSVSLNSDPTAKVGLSFSLQNTNPSVPVTFDIVVGTFAFAPLGNAQASATSSLTLTEGSLDFPVASLIGGFSPSSKAYQARYSTASGSNTGTVFGTLDASMSFGDGDTSTTNETEKLPNTGTVALNTTAYMMEAELQFTLSNLDQASGTSLFTITPEPTTISLLVLGGLLLGRRRSLAR
jgi:hypothetical protein